MGGRKSQDSSCPSSEGGRKAIEQGQSTKPFWTNQRHKDWSPKYYRSHQRNQRNSLATSLGKIRQECTRVKKTCRGGAEPYKNDRSGLLERKERKYCRRGGIAYQS